MDKGTLSFGVELELYIAVCVSGNSMPRPERFELHPGRPLQIDQLDRYEVTDTLASRIMTRVRKIAPRAIVHQRPGNNRRAIDPLSQMSLMNYQEWSVTLDPSLREIADLVEESEEERYGWLGVEVVSPALWATKAGFDEVRQVCDFIQNTFWITTPPTAGLHIHVGFGGHWPPLMSLRQVAAFLYAADPILAHSHPGHRWNNRYCPSIRLYSRVSRGMQNRHAPQRPSQINEQEHYVPSFNNSVSPPTMSLGSYLASLMRKPTSNEEKPTRSNFPPRPTGSAHKLNPQMLQDTSENPLVVLQGADLHPVPMLEAVDEILQCENIDTLSDLMGINRVRGTFNFNNLSYDVKRTIEFRQGASTIDSIEVISRARIAIRLCEFAAGANPSELMKIIIDFSAAEFDSSWYDFYDLFMELGLHPEAKVVQACLNGTMSDDVRREYLQRRELGL
ncbi:hypothetical protein F4819DRAFT_509090 [Hypoxylon fuscum]|nr:hypothetical protein F4819DRAFT_509090 [Hypoxylon fuscum]